jgi:hypothetical protein
MMHLGGKKSNKEVKQANKQTNKERKKTNTTAQY